MTFADSEAEAAEPESALRRWLTAWVGIGAAIVVVTALFLVLIGNSLSRIDDDLTAANTAVGNVSGSTAPLPQQVERVNRSLEVIEAALRVLPKDTDTIASNLTAMIEAMELIEADLAATAPNLASASKNLEPSAKLIGPIGANLKETAALLMRILGNTGSIHDSLAAIDGRVKTGLAGVRANLAAVNAVLTAVRGDLGDILATNRRINGHLESICRSPAVGLRSGPQSC
ncbi:MAG: hypothetical protein ACT4QG_05810 [Sporichthyaceae bacterium]